MHVNYSRINSTTSSFLIAKMLILFSIKAIALVIFYLIYFGDIPELLGHDF